MNLQVLISQQRAPRLFPEYHINIEKKKIQSKSIPLLIGSTACMHNVMQIRFNLLHVFLLPPNLLKKIDLSLLVAVNSYIIRAYSDQDGVSQLMLE